MGELTPVMTKLEIILQAINVNNVKVENIRFSHSSYDGLDRNMNWQHAAVVIKRSTGGKYFEKLSLKIIHCRNYREELGVLPHCHDGALRGVQLQGVGGEERLH